MNQAIRSILIVGGGTAGWLSAAYLQRALGDTVKITLIESASVPTVGVGEATIPTLRNTLRFIGLNESQWMARCDATYKIAIHYRHWCTGPGDPTDHFYHPFFPRPESYVRAFEQPYFPIIGEGLSSALYWMRRAAGGARERYDYLANPIARLCDAQRFGAAGGEPVKLPHAYHMDASKFALVLRDLSVERGVKHLVGHVQVVSRREDGFIEKVTTSDGRELSADLFLDCTGFRGALIRGALDEPFINDGKYLPSDAAVAIQIPVDPAADGLRPYTIAQAHRAGWSWNVPLANRHGCGYVYSSKFIDKDAAETEIRQHLGDRAEGSEARHLRMRVGRSERLWVNNCIAIGLSGMFLEPLESTSIFFTEFQLAQLVTLFPDRRFSPPLARNYNRILSEMYEHVRDFIVMHFCTTQRSDSPYWRAIQSEVPIPDSLAQRLEDFRLGFPPIDTMKLELFRTTSLTAILSGMRVYPERSSPILEHVDNDAQRRYFAEVRRSAAELCEKLPTHRAYVESQYALTGEAG